MWDKICNYDALIVRSHYADFNLFVVDVVRSKESTLWYDEYMCQRDLRFCWCRAMWLKVGF